MFVIRQAQSEDYSTLSKLAKMVRFVNLPSDAELLRAKISRSRRSFMGRTKDEREREFMFVLEDVGPGTVIGTSWLCARNSWPGHPHLHLSVRKREHYSEDLQTGAVHVVLQIGTDTSGASELGGLVVSPAYRGHPEKLGAQLSLVRFHFMGLHRSWFSDRVIAQLMPPLTPDSNNSLWEYLGRRFINLSYAEADEFSRNSKEFITSLLPKGEIYASLLPPEARALIGRVSDEARPARAMLERLGFRYNQQIDPFDGGPTLEARTDEIPLVQQTHWGTLGAAGDQHAAEGLISATGEHGFRAVRTGYTEQDGVISLSREAIDALGVAPGTKLGLTPLKLAGKPGAPDDERGTQAIETERVGG